MKEHVMHHIKLHGKANFKVDIHNIGLIIKTSHATRARLRTGLQILGPWNLKHGVVAADHEADDVGAIQMMVHDVLAPLLLQDDTLGHPKSQMYKTLNAARQMHRKPS